MTSSKVPSAITRPRSMTMVLVIMVPSVNHADKGAPSVPGPHGGEHIFHYRSLPETTSHLCAQNPQLHGGPICPAQALISSNVSAQTFWQFTVQLVPDALLMVQHVARCKVRYDGRGGLSEFKTNPSG